MSLASLSIWNHHKILGCFVNKETNAVFEYTSRFHPDDSFAPKMKHTIFVGNDQTRLATVLKTIVYVVVDEDENGPVVEKWHIKAHRHYSR